LPASSLSAADPLYATSTESMGCPFSLRVIAECDYCTVRPRNASINCWVVIGWVCAGSRRIESRNATSSSVNCTGLDCCSFSVLMRPYAVILAGCERLINLRTIAVPGRISHCARRRLAVAGLGSYTARVTDLHLRDLASDHLGKDGSSCSAVSDGKNLSSSSSS